MRGKIGLAIVLLAAAAWVANEDQSFAGRRHRRACGSCATGCATACGTSACGTSVCGPSGCTVAPEAEAPAAPSPSDDAPPAPSADASSSEEAPQVASTTVTRPSTYSYTASRRARRGWRRR